MPAGNRKQAIAWANVDPVISHHMMSLDQSELKQNKA